MAQIGVIDVNGDEIYQDLNSDCVEEFRAANAIM